MSSRRYVVNRVISSRVGGISDSVIDQKSGILCEPGNMDEIQQAIRFFYEHPKERHRFGRAGRAFVEEKFSIVTMIDAFENLYGTDLV